MYYFIIFEFLFIHWMLFLPCQKTWKFVCPSNNVISLSPFSLRSCHFRIFLQFQGRWCLSFCWCNKNKHRADPKGQKLVFVYCIVGTIFKLITQPPIAFFLNTYYTTIHTHKLRCIAIEKAYVNVLTVWKIKCEINIKHP